MFVIHDMKGKGVTCNNCGKKADMALIVESKLGTDCQPPTIMLCKDCFVDLYAKLQSEFWNNDNLI